MLVKKILLFVNEDIETGERGWQYLLTSNTDAENRSMTNCQLNS